MSGSNSLRLFSLLFVLILSLTDTAQAQGVFPAKPAGEATPQTQLFSTKNPAPDTTTIPALNNLVKSGAKLHYMGERSGLHGWLIEKEGQIQMIYLAPDRQTVIIGGMFSSQGENVTSPQLQALMGSNPDVKAIFDSSAHQQREIMQAGGEQGGATSVPGNMAASKSPPASMPAAVSLSPGERLIQDMKAAAGVVLGDNSMTEILMFVAPSCPNCKSTWKELRESVFAKKIQIRLIPVYNSMGPTERNMAAQLLRAQAPLDAWDRFVGGDVSVLSGTPDDVSLRAIESNLMLISKWNIQGYPYLVYRSKDGRVKIVQGKPERMAAVLADLIQ